MLKRWILSFYTIVALCAVAIYFSLKYFEQLFTGRNNTNHDAYKNIAKNFCDTLQQTFPKISIEPNKEAEKDWKRKQKNK